MGLGNISLHALLNLAVNGLLFVIVIVAYLYAYSKSKLRPTLLIALAFILKAILTPLMPLLIFLIPPPILVTLYSIAPNVIFAILLIVAALELARINV